MKRTTSALFFVCIGALLLAARAFAFGPDVRIHAGVLNAFDADYALSDGTTHVVLQAQGENSLRWYSSTDHGKTWTEVRTIATGNALYATAARNDIGLLQVVYDDADGILFVFYVDSDWYLFVNGFDIATGNEVIAARVGNERVVNEAFDAAINVSDGRLYAVWGYQASNSWPSRIRWRYSDTNGSSWTDGPWRDLTYYLDSIPSVAYGPPDHVYTAYVELQPVGLGSVDWRLIFERSTDDLVSLGTGETVDYFGTISNETAILAPLVAAANVDASGVWVLYAKDKGGGVYGLLSRYSPDGGTTWNPATSAGTNTSVSEYPADLKFYKDAGNGYVDMVYYREDTVSPPNKKLIWAYASTGDPSNWFGRTIINDQDVLYAPGGMGKAPKIVYSPGAAASGGGVIFEYHAGGLYFDAPWIGTDNTLTITVSGDGTVSDPSAGITCVGNASQTTTCPMAVAPGTTLALDATPGQPGGSPWSFSGWSGACSGTGTCVLTMDTDKSIVADFQDPAIAPITALNIPTGQDIFPPYTPENTPVKNGDPSLCKPLAIDDFSTGLLRLRLGLPMFLSLGSAASGVDVYVAVYCNVIDPNDLYLFLPGNSMQPLQDGLVPRFASIPLGVELTNESVFADIPLQDLPSGVYNFSVAVTPEGAGNLNQAYLWSTSVTIP
jgi:hypothetical protein